MPQARRLRRYLPRSCHRLAEAEGVLVQPMLGVPVAELLVAVRRDETVGLVATVGAGGVWTEVLRDAAHVLLPFRPEAVVDVLAELRIGARLRGARGKEPARMETMEAVEALAAGTPA